MKVGQVESLSADEWSALLAVSPQRTRFLDPDFLDLFDVPVRYWGLNRKGVVIAGMPVIDASRFGSRALPWCYYQGIVYHDEVWRSAPAKRTQYTIEVSEALATGVALEEAWFSISLSPALSDVRGLDWVHYHDPSRPRLVLQPRYTGIAPITGETPGSLRKRCRSARRQEEGYAKTREGLVATSDGTIDELVGVYRATFERQGVDVSDSEIGLLKAYSSYFMDQGTGGLLAVRDSDERALAVALVFTDYDGTVHVPVIGTGETRYGGTLLYFHILDEALKQGALAVDFNGANSPKRAYFKHSMGADAVLYFEASWDAARGAT